MTALAEQVYAKREAAFGAGAGRPAAHAEIERVIMLRVVDEYWMDHIDAMGELKRGIGLRGYGSVKPIDAYKQEGFEMFEGMVHGIREETVRRLFTVQVRTAQPIERKSVAKNAAANVGGEPEKKKAREESAQARPERPLPLRQDEAGRQQKAEIQRSAAGATNEPRRTQWHLLKTTWTGLYT